MPDGARIRRALCVRLTPRELEIAHLVALGYSARQIGQELRLTQQSIERRIRQIADKIDGDLPPRNRITRWWWQSQQPPTISEDPT
jgi:DNA-binding CsgD family transcriptional regulator